MYTSLKVEPALVRTLVKLFEELGGELRLSTVKSAELVKDGGRISIELPMEMAV